MQTNDYGNLGEDIAKRYLLSVGCEIRQRNFHSRYGEIDIIAKGGKSDILIFAEVKARSVGMLGQPCEAVSRTKQAKIIKTALWYLQNCEEDRNLQPRFDIIEVYINHSGKHKINHIKNAFGMEAVHESFRFAL